jgi:hypothetical protein
VVRCPSWRVEAVAGVGEREVEDPAGLEYAQLVFERGDPILDVLEHVVRDDEGRASRSQSRG